MEVYQALPFIAQAAGQGRWSWETFTQEVSAAWTECLGAFGSVDT